MYHSVLVLVVLAVMSTQKNVQALSHCVESVYFCNGVLAWCSLRLQKTIHETVQWFWPHLLWAIKFN